MSAFKVGDVCKVLDAGGPQRDAIGLECTIVEIFASPDFEGDECLIDVHGFRKGPERGYWGAPFRILRKIDPPNKDEPITDFVPCEPEFFQDLMKRVKQREAL